MADIRINALANTASSTASDDFLAVDGTTNGTRKLSAYSPTFGGNFQANGTGTIGGVLTVNSTTDSSSKDTGAIITEGGLGVEKSATIGGNLTVSGDASIGTNVFKIDSTNTRILLGLASALQGDTLEVQSKLNSGAISLFGRASDNGSQIAFRANGASTQKAAIFGSDAGLSLIIGSTAKLSVNSSGDTTAAGNLTVSGTGTFSSKLTGNELAISGGGNNAAGTIYSDANWGMIFKALQTNPNAADFLWLNSTGTEHMRITTNGGMNLVGGATLGGNLTVSGTGTSSFGGVVQVSNTLAAKETNASLTLQPGPGTGGINYAFGQGTGDHVFYGGTTERMRLGYGGNLLIGTATDTNNRLRVYGDGSNEVLRLDSGGAFGSIIIGYRTTPSTVNTGPITNWQAYNGATRTSLIEQNCAGPSDSGRIDFWTKASGGSITTALTLDSSQRCILAGALRLNNAYTAGAPTATGYVTLQDSAGNTYKVLVGT